jgi:hypothetical protein
MKYNEIIQFEPIKEVVKFSKTEDAEYQKDLVKTFVFSKAYEDVLIPIISKNLNYAHQDEKFGLQVVGNYGTGKSHLMSLVSLIAEDENFLELVKSEKPKNDLSGIAGKFKVLRFELGNTQSLWDVLTYKLETWLNENGVNFSFADHDRKTFAEQLQQMMAEFEEVYPSKGFLVVIDEMLAYLKSRSEATKLNEDLMVLQALGQSCDNTKFRIMFGVQELIYRSPEFQFASEMLQKVGDRYRDLTITKEDVSFVVKKRLLKKDTHQKAKIRKHLQSFVHLFSNMHSHLEEYVELFPVHPSYFDNFQRIRKGKSQREILKTLSAHFEKINDNAIPTNNPGLITYDDYWIDIANSPELMSDPDIRKVKEVMDTVHDKIDSFFTGPRKNKKPIAEKIANACAIKILQAELNKSNGTNIEELIDDLCHTDQFADERDFLMDTIDSTAQNIITATSGQYFDKNPDNGEYYIRVEGGVNFDQKIKDYAAQMSPSQRDDAFFDFLEKNLPLAPNTYRTGFKIWEHTIDWKSHKTYRDGYIFFGNPNEKSTTHPRQHFYMYFMPIFDEEKKVFNHDSDEIYFIMDGLSDDFKQAVSLYGAAKSLEATADSSQKTIYRQKIKELNTKARQIFDKEYITTTQVDYKGDQTPLSGYSLPPTGSSKEQVFSEVASQALEDWFEDETPDYPEFKALTQPIAKNNFERRIKGAIQKIINPNQANTDGEAILSGMGLWIPGQLDYSHSIYAKSLLKKLKDKGAGKVLNRDEILECRYPAGNLWVSKDYQLEAELEFLVIATLTALGEMEVTFSSGKGINSTNLQELRNISGEDFFNFSHVKPPKGLNLAALKAVFSGLGLPDLSNNLRDENTLVRMVAAADEMSKKAVTLKAKISDGVRCRGVEVIPEWGASKITTQFDRISGFCDKLRNYTSEAKLKNFQYSKEEVDKIFAQKNLIDEVDDKLQLSQKFEDYIGYLVQCRQYLPDGEMKNEIQQSINQLGTVLSKGDAKTISQYEASLKSLIDRYANYYLEKYTEYRISEKDETQKQVLMQSTPKKVCDILREAEFLSTAKYQKWLDQLLKLKVADPSVNKNALLNTPYLDFNPLDYLGQPKITLKQLEYELEEILDQWSQTLRDTLDDPAIKRNIDAIDTDQQKLLEDFKNEKIELNEQHARHIRNTLNDLHKGLDKIELSTEALKPNFSKPLTPDEAVDAFKAYIDQITRGKERDKIRIILK